MQIPDNKICAITESDKFNDSVDRIIKHNRKNSGRDWMVTHSYFCLPLQIGNQYTFTVYSDVSFKAIWNGGEGVDDVKIEMEEHSDSQFASSHFGMGLITIQNRFQLRTPEGVNLMTMDPINELNPYLKNLNAVVETDNLRRDFTFNIKIQRPNEWVEVKKGDPISAVLPIPRYFADSFDVEEASKVLSKEDIEEERKTAREFGRRRMEEDPNKPNGNGRLYFFGKDAWDDEFDDHQKRMTKAPSKCPYSKLINRFKK